ncbi:endonuclease domain-containing protein [Oerskovia sp. NPDC056781]|uniref:endonuclease domain-containing protein n=1 Tax=Oerskovia sp. NPDC056781 TaxID=3345942 RepID=UPI00366C9DB3
MRTDEPFTVAEGRACGLSPKMLRHPRLAIPTRGLRVAAEHANVLSVRAAAVMRSAPLGSAISHGSALRLHGVDLPWQVARDDRVHLSVPSSAVVPRRTGYVAHTHDADLLPVRLQDGLLVVTPEHAWRQLAGTLPLDELVVLGDSLLRRTSPASTLGQLRETVRGTPAGARGVARMRTALDDLRTGTDSPMETRTRLLLVRAGLPCPQVNVPVVDGTGRFVALPDMVYVAERVAIEYDGDVHRTDARTWRRDVAKRQWLEDLGWRTVVATSDDVYRHPSRLVARVAALLRSRAVPGPAEK